MKESKYKIGRESFGDSIYAIKNYYYLDHIEIENRKMIYHHNNTRMHKDDYKLMKWKIYNQYDPLWKSMHNFSDVIIILFRDYDNIYHFVEGINSLLHYYYSRVYFPKIEKIFLFDHVYYGNFSGWVKGYFVTMLDVISDVFNPQIIPYKRNQILHFDRVILVPITTSIRNPFDSCQELNIMRSQIYKNYNLYLNKKSPLTILIPIREKNRIILNVDDLVNELEKYYGFVKKQDLGKLSFDKQVRMIHSASIVISSHGAQLINIIFMQPKTYLIEIFNPYFYKTCYPNIAKTASLNYISITSSDIVEISPSDECPKAVRYQPYVNCNISIAIANFSRILKPLLRLI